MNTGAEQTEALFEGTGSHGNEADNAKASSEKVYEVGPSLGRWNSDFLSNERC